MTLGSLRSTILVFANLLFALADRILGGLIVSTLLNLLILPTLALRYARFARRDALLETA